MSKYMPQETYIVCSHQVNPNPGNIVNDPNFWNLSVNQLFFKENRASDEQVKEYLVNSRLETFEVKKMAR